MTEFPSLSGDLIFFSPKKGISANIAIQSTLRGGNALHSHIAIVAKQGNALHAMPKIGVHISSIRSLLKDRQGEFLVYRNRDLCRSRDIVDLEDHIWFYNHQKYNMRFFFASRHYASFCSELVSKAYTEIERPISDKTPSRTLPIDIYKYIISSNEWDDVTKQYEDFFLKEDYPKVLDLVSSFVQNIEEKNQTMTYQQHILKNTIRALAERDEQPYSERKIRRRYWTDPIDPRQSKFLVTLLAKTISTLFKRK